MVSGRGGAGAWFEGEGEGMVRDLPLWQATAGDAVFVACGYPRALSFLVEGGWRCLVEFR